MVYKVANFHLMVATSGAEVVIIYMRRRPAGKWQFLNFHFWWKWDGLLKDSMPESVKSGDWFIICGSREVPLIVARSHLIEVRRCQLMVASTGVPLMVARSHLIAASVLCDSGSEQPLVHHSSQRHLSARKYLPPGRRADHHHHHLHHDNLHPHHRCHDRHPLHKYQLLQRKS